MRRRQESLMKDTTIFHIDVNSAFLSWSAVKRLREDPDALDLRTVPSAVGGDVDSRHGIISAKSIPAKKYDIHTGMPVVKALQQCPDLILVPGDFETYHAYSHAFITILRKYSDKVEQASIDEAYMDVSGTAGIYSSFETETLQFPLSLAYHIKNEIRDTLGFTVNVGVSSNKLLAKMASDFEKPDKVHTLFPDEIEDKMWPLPIGSLFGCGGKTAERLHSYGIKTIGDAAHSSEKVLKSILGEKAGEYIFSAANGHGSTFVNPVRDEAKSYSNEYTVSHDINASNFEAEAPQIIRRLSESVGKRLRRDNVFGRTVVVSVKTNEFKRHSIQRGLDSSTNSTEVIYSTALALLKEISFGKQNNTFLNDFSASKQKTGSAESFKLVNDSDKNIISTDIIHGKKVEHFSDNNGRIRKGLHPDNHNGNSDDFADQSAVNKNAGLLSDNRTGYRLLGVGVTNLDHGEERQLSIFDFSEQSEEEKTELERENRLDRMEDEIMKRFGKGAIHKGT